MSLTCQLHLQISSLSSFSMSRLLVHSVYPRGFSFLVFERAEAGVKQGEGCKKDLPKRHFLRGGHFSPHTRLLPVFSLFFRLNTQTQMP